MQDLHVRDHGFGQSILCLEDASELETQPGIAALRMADDDEIGTRQLALFRQAANTRFSAMRGPSGRNPTISLANLFLPIDHHVHSVLAAQRCDLSTVRVDAPSATTL